MKFPGDNKIHKASILLDIVTLDSDNNLIKVSRQPAAKVPPKSYVTSNLAK